MLPPKQFLVSLVLVSLLSPQRSEAGGYRSHDGDATQGGPDAWTYIHTPVYATLIVDAHGYALGTEFSNHDPKHAIYISGGTGDQTYNVATGHSGREIGPGSTVRIPINAYQSQNNKISHQEFTYEYWDETMDENDPHAIRPHPSSTSDGRSGGSGLANEVTSSASKLADAENLLSTFKLVEDSVRTMNGSLNQLSDQAAKLAGERDKLETEKARALADMRNGAFCRACHRTKSQIESLGESWQEHLNQNSGGVAVPATPEEMAAKAKEFDDRIASVAAEQARVEAEYAQTKQRRDAEAAKTNPLADKWFVAMRVAGRLLIEESEAKKKELASKIQEHERLISSLSQLQAKARTQGEESASKGNLAGEYGKQKEILQGETELLKKEQAQASNQYQLDHAKWARKLLDGRNEIQKAAVAAGFSAPPLPFDAPDLNLGAALLTTESARVGDPASSGASGNNRQSSATYLQLLQGKPDYMKLLEGNPKQ
jgi:hypothetical protein